MNNWCKLKTQKAVAAMVEVVAHRAAAAVAAGVVVVHTVQVAVLVLHIEAVAWVPVLAYHMPVVAALADHMPAVAASLHNLAFETVRVVDPLLAVAAAP